MKRIGAACALLLALLYLLDPTLLGAEWWLFDLYSRRLASSRKPDPRIVLVTVSEATTRALAEDFGRPQTYSREVYARVLDELTRNGASLVVFDLLLAEPNENAPEGDRAFAAQLASSPAILGAQTLPGGAQQHASIDPRWAKNLWSVQPLTRRSASALSRERERAAPQEPGEGLHYVAITPHPMFAAATGIGTMRLAGAARGSTVHHYPLADRVDGGYVPSLALEAARHVASKPRVLEGGELQMLVRWNGAKQSPDALSYPNVGLDKVLLASFYREEGQHAAQLAQFGAQFRGKIVLVGFTATGLFDLRPTPLSSQSAGLEIHANALDNLLNRDFTRTASRWLMFPLLILLGTGFGAAIARPRSQLITALGAILALAIVIGAGYAALAAGFFVPALTAALIVALTYVAITVWKYVAEQQQTAVLKMTFGRYVSPQILDHILAHPEKVQLGGERRDLTILFSDIRGFTSISEASEPEEVVEMLNEYLTRMVEILLAHGGTLDKFIGDAVMGFWNAPARDPEHARHAVACAVEMVRETARLRERWEGEGKPPLRIGIGINTGEAVVGNIGSQRVFGYTVIGDAVNLASRLEGKNKDYVTEIIISEFTLARIGDEFETVYLDDVLVKGKANSVKIYAVKV